MIDWFASKIGLLIFIVVSVGVLLSLAGVQLGIHDQGMRMQAASDVARLVDGLCEGCFMQYGFDSNYTVRVWESGVEIGGVSRPIISPAITASFSSTAILIEKQGGIVNVSKV